MVCILYGKDYETIADLVEEMHRDFLNVADKIVNDKAHFKLLSKPLSYESVIYSQIEAERSERLLGLLPVLHFEEE